MAKYATIFLLLSCVYSHVTAAKPKIIIVGAGAAGIGAATRLIEKNITDFIILEAEGRLGGRVKSVFVLDGDNGGFVDIGAEFLAATPGGDKNIVYNYAKQDVKVPDFANLKQKNYYSNGKTLDPEVVADLAKLTANYGVTGYKGKHPVSVEQAYTETFNDTLLKKYANDPVKVKQATDFKGTAEKYYLLRTAAFSWRNLLFKDHFEFYPGDTLMIWQGNGFIRAFERIMAKFGDEKRLKLYPIYYGTTVEKVNWGNGHNVQLLTKGGQKYEADHIIFTASAGVLKSRHEKMFIPKLPEVKAKALKDTGFGTIMKIVLQYDKKWWTDDILEFVFTFSDEDEEELSKQFKLDHQKDGKSWLRSCYKFTTIDGLPNTLNAWIFGPEIPHIEKLDVETLRQGMFTLSKRMLGKDYNVTLPKIIIPSDWYSNPNFIGAFTHEYVLSGNRKTKVQNDLAEPLLNKNKVPVVLFAGEHTSPNHFGSVHGAFETGFRAADELVAHLQKKN